MASTSSLGATASTSSAEAQTFYTDFTRRLADAQKSIDASTDQTGLAVAASSLAEARALLTDKTSVLPPYDQQRHEQNLKEVHRRLVERTSVLAPKKKFAFRRSAKVAAAHVTANDANHGTVPSALAAVAGEAARSATHLQRICNLKGQRIAQTAASDATHLQATGLELDNLEDCFVDTRDLSSANDVKLLSAHIRSLRHCVVLLGYIEGSVFIDGCQDCIVVVSCRQFRMHKTACTSVLLATESIATLEACRTIQFGACSDVQCRLFENTATDDAASRQPSLRIQDFDHISQLSPSPHWSKLSANEASAMLLAVRQEQQHPDSMQSGYLQRILAQSRSPGREELS